MPAFVVARLIPVPARILADPQRLESLRANKDPRMGSDPGFINLFHISINERLGDAEWIVDFNQFVSIPGSEFPGILRSKILQMDDRSRVKFKIKLAASLARLTEDEQKRGLNDPWDRERGS